MAVNVLTKPTGAPISQIYFVKKLYMFGAVPLPETCRVSWQNKFGKLVRLLVLLKERFVAMHGHMNVKFVWRLD